MSDLTPSERDALIARARRLTRTLFDDDLTDAEMRRLDAERDAVRDEYAARLPRVPVGRCPLTGRLTTQRIDAFGLDGPWWDVLADGGPPDGGPTLVAFTGALDLSRLDPASVVATNSHEVKPGPAVPYVIPRLLGLPGVVCTVTSRALVGGRCRAYFVCYYSLTPPPASQRHQGWPRDSYYFATPSGGIAWDSKGDLWDFDLNPWRAQYNKLYWAAPDDDAVLLKAGHDPAFPYADLPGDRFPRTLRQGCLVSLPLPDGSPPEPFD